MSAGIACAVIEFLWQGKLIPGKSDIFYTAQREDP
jgi:hypothetical protein